MHFVEIAKVAKCRGRNSLVCGLLTKKVTSVTGHFCLPYSCDGVSAFTATRKNTGLGDCRRRRRLLIITAGN